jgi:hypothetical protein
MPKPALFVLRRNVHKACVVSQAIDVWCRSGSRRVYTGDYFCVVFL